MRQVFLRQSSSKATFLAALLVTGSLMFSGCSSISGGNTSNAAAITVPSATVRVNQYLQVSATSPAAGGGMAFSVNGVPGGNAAFGTISSTGLYTAPATIPATQPVVVLSSEISPTVTAYAYITIN